MNNTFFNFAAGGAVIGVIAACWANIKTFAWKIASMFVQRVELRDDGYLHPVLLGYLIRNFKRSAVYDKKYCATLEHIRAQERNGMVPYEAFGSQMLIFWNGWIPFIFSGISRKSDKSGSGGSAGSGSNESTSSLTFLRGTLDAEELIRAAVRERNTVNWENEKLSENEQKRFYVKYVPPFAGKESIIGGQSGSSLPWYQEGRYRLLDFKPSELGRGSMLHRSALDDLIFPDNVRDLIDEIRLWRVNREWYHKRTIPWKRGFLLHGVPGAGKTSLARAFAEDLDMPIWVFNLGELNNFEFMKYWIEMQQAAPCIALIEDIDNVFHGRKNVATGRRSIFSMYSKRAGSKQKSGNMNPLTGGVDPSSSDSGDNHKPVDDDDDDDDFMGGVLSFDVFLNMLDGVERNDGIFTIVTTNNLHHIDPALGRPVLNPDGSSDFVSTRPGRIDKAVELTYMTHRDKLRMAERILGDYPCGLETVLEHLNNNPGVQETPAQFQERCAQLALREFWKQQFTGALPPCPPADLSPPKPGACGIPVDAEEIAVPRGKYAREKDFLNASLDQCNPLGKRNVYVRSGQYDTTYVPNKAVGEAREHE